MLMKTRVTRPPLEPERPALTVKAVRLTPRSLVLPLEGFGTARAERVASVSAQVAGEIVERPRDLRVGSAVEAGQLLIRIDDRDYRARRQQAQSHLAAELVALEALDIEQRNCERLIEIARDELAVAEREYSRVLALYEDEVSNPRELDQARLALKQARRSLQGLENELALLPKRREQVKAAIELREAELELAGLNLERCTIVAPFAGRIEQIEVEIGEQVQPAQRLVRLLDPRQIEVPIELPVSQRDAVRVGAGVRLMLESHPQAEWTGRIRRIAPSADERLRTFALYVIVSNTEQPAPLMPGMFVRARIDGPQLSDALLVPRGAVRQQRVFICEDGRALQRDVRVRHDVLDQTVIDGLEPGQIVITSNLDVLYDGAPVEPVFSDAEQPPLMVAEKPATGAEPVSAPQVQQPGTR